LEREGQVKVEFKFSEALENNVPSSGTVRFNLLIRLAGTEIYLSTPMGKALDTQVIEDVLASILTLTRARRYYVIVNNEINSIDFEFGD